MIQCPFPKTDQKHDLNQLAKNAKSALFSMKLAFFNIKNKRFLRFQLVAGYAKG
jgi:hypothetical protein